jgi:Transposase Tn5 dimerisation domain
MPHSWTKLSLDAMSRPAGERAEFLIRAKCDRRIAKGPVHSYLWAELQGTRPLGTMTIALARTPDRAPRQATVAVAVQQVTFNQARRLGGKLPPVAVTAIYAAECQPPRGEEPIGWLLLTSLPVTDFPSACTVVQWYRCRWEMELFFRVLKQGCQIERLRLQTDQRLLNAIAIYLIIAWRIHTITLMGRAYPEEPCDVVFEPCEWRTLYIMQYKTAPPQDPPPLRVMVRSLAQLGGFLARRGDGEPGVKALWQGYQRLHEFIYALETHRTVSAL